MEQAFAKMTRNLFTNLQTLATIFNLNGIKIIFNISKHVKEIKCNDKIKLCHNSCLSGSVENCGPCILTGASVFFLILFSI